MITDIEDFFCKGCGRCPRFATADCSTRRWDAGLRKLRDICRSVGLDEVVKWGHPCYMHAGRNIAIFGAFRDDFRLTFFDAVLLTDPDRILEKISEHSKAATIVRFTDPGQPAAMEASIRACLTEAMGYAKAGKKPPRTPTEFELPDALAEAMDVDPDLAEAFAALTPGRQKSWALHVAGAKKPETRLSRIEAARDKILAGKGALDR